MSATSPSRGGRPGRLAVLHVAAGRSWGSAEAQVRLLIRALAVTTRSQLCLCMRGSALADRLRFDALPVRTLPAKSLADPRTALAVARVVGRFDVVHCHDGGSLQVTVLPARLAGVPVVATRRARLRALPPAWQLAHRILVPWRALTARGRIRAALEARIRVVPDAVDVDEVQRLAPLDPPLRTRAGVARDAFLLGGTAPAHAAKPYEILAKALELIPGAHAVVMAEGSAREQLERVGRMAGVATRLHVVGGVPDPRCALREFDLFVAPADDDDPAHDVLDAMAAGVPVVAANAGGAAELLAPVHASTGSSVFPPGDSAALAALVLRLRRDAERLRSMLRAQRLRIADFRLEQTAVATLAVYQELVSNNH